MVLKVCRGKKWEALNVVPMKMAEVDKNIFGTTDGSVENVLAQLADTRSRVKNGGHPFPVFIDQKVDVETGGIAPKMLKSWGANGYRPPHTIKFNLPDVLFHADRIWVQNPTAEKLFIGAS
ncbi:MAG: hypothetical protein AAFP02_23910 [Bacteroidota bacterium]